jgi:hypothetical protein
VEKNFHLDIRSRRRENICFRKWVLVRRAHGKVFHRTKLVAQDFCTCEIGVYMREHSRDICVLLKKHVVLVRIGDQTFPGLSAVVFLSTDHYPWYGSPDFRIIKSFLALVSPPGFFPGVSTQKYWCSCVH